MILLYTAFNLPFTIWMMKSFFDELSPEVEDAARLDGSNGYRVFFRICMPQVKAGLAATAVFGLILTWNEFLFALLLTGVETRTVPVAMAQTIGGDIGVRWGLLAAIETLFLIPVVSTCCRTTSCAGSPSGPYGARTAGTAREPCPPSAFATSPSASAPWWR